MNRLARRIAQAIDAEGPLAISTFMTLALHDPRDGFYATRDTIGAKGAFITAPEISQVFGELLGLWCAQVWQDQGRPRPARIVELGPGRGTLMRDALRAANLLPDFLAAIEVVLVEASPALQAVQRETLSAAETAIRWARQWDEIVNDRPVFLLANEFFDALPVRQFVWTERGWCERMVSVGEAGDLAFVLAPIPSAVVARTERGPMNPGAVYEISPAAEVLAEDISRVVAEKGGAALFIDYGHAGRGYGDTLQAVGGHRPADILRAPGEVDISVHVDFAALARSAAREDARVCGPVDQGDFLRSLGIKGRGARLTAHNPAHAQEIGAAIERLLSPHAMGALFKALAIAPGDAPPPPGF